VPVESVKESACVFMIVPSAAAWLRKLFENPAMP
jgi:hypothetical protein